MFTKQKESLTQPCIIHWFIDFGPANGR